MTVLEPSSATIQSPEDPFRFDEAELAAVSFLARYSGRTLEADRHDLPVRHRFRAVRAGLSRVPDP
jgi:hypothetical protein